MERLLVSTSSIIFNLSPKIYIMIQNGYILFLIALIPLVVGFVWYNPKVFGNVWLKASGVDPKPPSTKQMLITFALTYVFGLFISTMMMPLTIHQMGLLSVFEGDPTAKTEGSEAFLFIKSFFATYGDRFRTFKHGALHGTIASLFLALPVIGVVSLFEKKGFKYIAVHVGYWIITLAVMGGLVCQFVKLN